MDAVALVRPEGCRPFAELLSFSPNPKDFEKLKEGRWGGFVFSGGDQKFPLGRTQHAWDGGWVFDLEVKPTEVVSQSWRRGHKDVAVASGVKGVQATFSRFLGIGSLRRTPAHLPALIDP